MSGERSYRFFVKFEIEREVVIHADDLIEAMEKSFDVSAEMLLSQTDFGDFSFPNQPLDATLINSLELDHQYRCDRLGNEIGDIDDRDSV